MHAGQVAAARGRVHTHMLHVAVADVEDERRERDEAAAPRVEQVVKVAPKHTTALEPPSSVDERRQPQSSRSSQDVATHAISL